MRISSTLISTVGADSSHASATNQTMAQAQTVSTVYLLVQVSCKFIKLHIKLVQLFDLFCVREAERSDRVTVTVLQGTLG